MSSVKVAVRVRPFNEREKGSKCCIGMVNEHTQCIPLSFLNSFYVSLFRKVKQQPFSIQIRVMKDHLHSITRSGVTIALSSEMTASWPQLARSMQIRMKYTKLSESRY